MTYCRICGTENGVVYRTRSCLNLCAFCHEETPRKVSFRDFCRDYFGALPEDLPTQDGRSQREFFDDYRCSTYASVASYRAATCEPC